MGLNIKGCVMELVGTFALCFVGGLVVQSQVDGSIEPIALAHGFVLAFMIYAGANVSGAHYNPAVTVALIVIKKCPVVDGLLFIVFQLVGSILAGFLVAVIVDEKAMEKIGWAKISGAEYSYCGCPNGISSSEKKGPPFRMLMQGAGIELIATFFLMLVIMGTAVDHRRPKAVAGIAIGLTLAMCIIANGKVTGGALNPFRSIGPIIGAGLLHPSEFRFFSQVWIYLLPFVGALIAALLYHFVIQVKEVTVQADKNMIELKANNENDMKL